MIFIVLLVVPWAAYNWYLESRMYMMNMVRPMPSKYMAVRIIRKVKCFFINIFRIFTDGKWLIIDIAVTIFFVSTLEIGGSVIGGIMGLLLSNCVSMVLLYYMVAGAMQEKLVIETTPLRATMGLFFQTRRTKLIFEQYRIAL